MPYITKSTRKFLFTLSAVISIAMGNANATVLALDDGVATIGLGVGVGTDALLLNMFTATAMVSTIEGVQFSFVGSPTDSVFDIILFSDPNNDGNPNDAIQLARDSVLTPSVIIPNEFVQYNFSLPVTITVGDNFFIGLYEPVASPNIGLGHDAAGGNSTWGYVGGDDPKGAGTLDTTANFGFPNDGMIRAVGSSSAVPEPSSLLLLGLSTLGFAAYRRRSM